MYHNLLHISDHLVCFIHLSCTVTFFNVLAYDSLAGAVLLRSLKAQVHFGAMASVRECPVGSPQLTRCHQTVGFSRPTDNLLTPASLISLFPTSLLSRDIQAEAWLLVFCSRHSPPSVYQEVLLAQASARRPGLPVPLTVP